MKLSDQNILFFSRTMGMGGTSNVMLALCEILKPLVNKIVVCSRGGVMTEKLDEMGIQHYTIGDIGVKKPQTMLSILKKVKTIIRDEQITLVHTHHRMAALYTRLALGRKIGRIAFLNTSHNTFSDNRPLTRFAYKKAGLIACGEMVKRNLVDFYGLPDSQVKVIHNAIRPFEGELIPDPTVTRLHDEGCFVVANVGRLAEQKGMEYYIDSIPTVLESAPNTRFLVIGSGEDEEKLKIRVKEQQIEDYVHFMGYRTDVQNLLAQTDLVVLSSLWEGLPLTPIEAFSVGKTIVATAVDGTPEVVHDTENGLLIPARDAQAIAEKVCYMIAHPEERSAMEKGAKETFEKDFSFARFTERYVEYYKRMIEQTGVQ